LQGALFKDIGALFAISTGSLDLFGDNENVHSRPSNRFVCASLTNISFSKFELLRLTLASALQNLPVQKMVLLSKFAGLPPFPELLRTGCM
jgi:hypothetical protein